MNYNTGTELGRLQFRASSYTWHSEVNVSLKELNGVCISFAKDGLE
jgi:hypothetical protein